MLEKCEAVGFGLIENIWHQGDVYCMSFMTFGALEILHQEYDPTVLPIDDPTVLLIDETSLVESG